MLIVAPTAQDAVGPSLPAHYRALYQSYPGSKELVIVFSPTRNFVMVKTDWRRNVLFLADKRANYYAQYPGRAVSGLLRFLREQGIEKTLFFGTSKGGFGALLWTALCAQKAPTLMWRCVAFSPQTLLVPLNERLYFPSYKNMMLRAERDPVLMQNLTRYGDAKVIEGLPNVFVTIVYSEKNRVDAEEASRLFGPNIRKLPLPFAFHGTLFPFVMDRSDPTALREFVTRIYKDIIVDPDLAATLPRNPDELASAILQTQWIPSLDTLLSEIFSVLTH